MLDKLLILVEFIEDVKSVPTLLMFEKFILMGAEKRIFEEAPPYAPISMGRITFTFKREKVFILIGLLTDKVVAGLIVEIVFVLIEVADRLLMLLIALLDILSGLETTTLEEVIVIVGVVM